MNLFDISKPGVGVMQSSFGGGWAWGITDAGTRALFDYFDRPPAECPAIQREAYIIEPQDAADLAQYLRDEGIAWAVES